MTHCPHTTMPDDGPVPVWTLHIHLHPHLPAAPCPASHLQEGPRLTLGGDPGAGLGRLWVQSGPSREPGAHHVVAGVCGSRSACPLSLPLPGPVGRDVMRKGGAKRNPLKCQGAPRAKVMLCTSPVIRVDGPLLTQPFPPSLLWRLGGVSGPRVMGFPSGTQWLPASVPLSKENSRGLLILPTSLTLCPKPPARTPHLSLEDSPDPRLVPLLVMP